MPRYVNQPESHACGPTVVLNALKWAGLPATLKHDFDNIATLCDYEQNEGSPEHSIDRSLRDLLKGAAKVRKPRFAMIWDIEEHLEKGGACVLTVTDWSDAHVFLVTGKRGKLFITHNYNHNKNTTLLRECTLQEQLDQRGVWMLTKEN